MFINVLWPWLWPLKSDDQPVLRLGRKPLLKFAKAPA
jgi:hypothetical protein